MLKLIPINIWMAVRCLSRNRLRTFLTMLGIIIGVAAVLTMVALGTGARGSVEGDVRSAGTNLIYVRAGNYTRGGGSVGIAEGRGAADTLVLADAQAIADTVEGVTSASPVVSTRTGVTAGAASSFTEVQGVGAEFAEAHKWTVDPGRMLRDSSSEAVLGRALANELFGPGFDPTGRMIRLRDQDYEIVGVTDDQTDGHDSTLFVPWRTLQSSLQINHLNSIVIAAEEAGQASRISAEVTDLLRQRHRIGGGTGEGSYLGGQTGGAVDDFTVETQAAEALTKGLYTPAAAFALANLPKLDEVTLSEMADTLDSASDTMTALLASIAGVSLIVGGIGIMNIMLVSVTERTREIGLRVATGARSSDVALQFLVEAVTLSVAGGLLGLLLGLASSRLIGWALEWPVSVPISAMGIAVGIAALVGLVFGIYPARRAAMLDPIDALRSE